MMFSHVRSCFFDFRVSWTVIFRFEIVKTLILEDEPINGKPQSFGLPLIGSSSNHIKDLGVFLGPHQIATNIHRAVPP